MDRGRLCPRVYLILLDERVQVQSFGSMDSLLPAEGGSMALLTGEKLDDPYLALLAEARRSQKEATIEILRAASGSGSIPHLMRDAGDRAGRYGDGALRISPPVLPLACKRGCYHCCWATVGVVAPEAIYLAEGLRAQLPQGELSALTDRAENQGQRLQQMNRGERLDARMPCALLRDGGCSAYQNRPLVCRWACSSSLQACLDLLVHRTKKYLEMEEVRYQPTQEVWLGLRAGLKELGLDGSLLALNSALAIALADPRIAQRYLSGEPVFDDARLE